MPAKTESRTRRLFIWRILSHIRRPPGYGTGSFDVSALSPTVNDIADKISPQTRIKLFADDCLLYRTIDTKQDHKQLQDLNTLVDWSHTWLMTFNAAKCHLLKITRKTKILDTEYKIDNHTLLRVQHHPYLRVELTSDLTWKHHIGLITGKAQKILNLLL